MKSILFFIFLSWILSAVCQTSEFEMYYPENTLYKKLKVKSEIDTIASPANHHFKKEFDINGRQTAWYYVEDSVKTIFQYLKKGDTLVKYHYNTVNGQPKAIYRFDKFVYNTKGSIIFYQTCERWNNKDVTDCKVEKFYYSENGLLNSKLVYHNSEYPYRFSKDLEIIDSLLILVDTYSYFFDKVSRLILKKQMIGKSKDRLTDSFFYDNKNRLIKNITTAKETFLGEFVVRDFKGIQIWEYDNANLIKSTIFSTFRNSGPELVTSGTQTNEFDYYSNGLLKKWIYKGDYYNSKKSILRYIIYEFY